LLKDDFVLVILDPQILLSLIVAIAQVNTGQKTGKFKAEERGKNILAQVERVIERRRLAEGWGGLAEEAGFETPGELFAVQRAVEWGQPFSADTKKLLEPTARK